MSVCLVNENSSAEICRFLFCITEAFRVTLHPSYWHRKGRPYLSPRCPQHHPPTDLHLHTHHPHLQERKSGGGARWTKSQAREAGHHGSQCSPKHGWEVVVVGSPLPASSKIKPPCLGFLAGRSSSSSSSSSYSSSSSSSSSASSFSLPTALARSSSA